MHTDSLQNTRTKYIVGKWIKPKGKSKGKIEEDVARKVEGRRKCGIAHAVCEEGCTQFLPGSEDIVCIVICLVSVGKTDVIL